MGDNDFRDVLPDPDPEQTLEWQEAIRAVSDALGPERRTDSCCKQLVQQRKKASKSTL